jgi:hypothetical protein
MVNPSSRLGPVILTGKVDHILPTLIREHLHCGTTVAAADPIVSHFLFLCVASILPYHTALVNYSASGFPNINSHDRTNKKRATSTQQLNPNIIHHPSLILILSTIYIPVNSLFL